MTAKIRRFVMTVIVSIGTVSCAADLSEGFTYDYTSAKISDFNGVWFGPVTCDYGTGYQLTTRVQITDGVGELSGYGKEDTADLDLQSGKISWAGKYLYAGGQGNYSLIGQWRENRFRVKGKRGPATCSGELKRTATS